MGKIPIKSVLQQLNESLPEFSIIEPSFNVQDIDLFDIQDFEIIYQLIPSNTRDENHLNIYKNSLPMIASKLLMDRRNTRKQFNRTSNIYLLRLHIFTRFAYFLIERRTDEINTYLSPFINNLEATEETSSFLEEIIGAEDNNYKSEQFWYIWDKLYPKIIELCNNPYGYYLNKVIKSYLLAWQWWREGVEEWRSLKQDNLWLYINAARDLGHIPAVLYSICKILNSIGSNFKSEGIDWIYTIVLGNGSLKLGELESNTLFYLEKFTRKFIFINKEKIKQEIKLKNKVIPILDFMIERGSIHGYLLRESIL